jgi:hypothetical protein
LKPRDAGLGSAATADAAELLRALAAVADWRIHVRLLQQLADTEFPNGAKTTLHRLVMRDLAHPNKFVRAWAYGGLATLARRFPEFESEVNEICAMGLRDESAAVKARIRNAWSKGRKATVRRPSARR